MSDQKQDSSLKKVATSAFILANITGCGQKSGAPAQDAPFNDNNAITNGDIRGITENQTVSCSGGECDESLIQVVVMANGEKKVCTGFLVESNLVVTSSNCLPDTVRVSQAQCQDKVFFVFPETGTKKREVLGCSHVESTSGAVGTDVILRGGDVAFVRMSGLVNRHPFAISYNGIKDNQPLSLWKITLQNKLTGIIERENCTASLQSYANPLANTPDSPVVPVGGCTFEEGNEGAPLLNDKGEVVGIYGQAISDDLLNYLTANNLVDSSSKPMVYVTNMACAPKAAGLATSAKCEQSISQSDIGNARNNMINDLSKHFTNIKFIESEMMKEVQAAKDRFFNWKFDLQKLAPGVSEILPTPNCFAKYQDWIERLHKPIIFWEYKDDHSVDQNFSSWRLETKFDELLRPVSKVIKDKTKKYSVRFSPSSLVRNGNSDVEVNDGILKRIFSKLINSDDQGRCK